MTRRLTGVKEFSRIGAGPARCVNRRGEPPQARPPARPGLVDLQRSTAGVSPGSPDQMVVQPLALTRKARGAASLADQVPCMPIETLACGAIAAFHGTLWTVTR